MKPSIGLWFIGLVFYSCGIILFLAYMPYFFKSCYPEVCVIPHLERELLPNAEFLLEHPYYDKRYADDPELSLHVAYNSFYKTDMICLRINPQNDNIFSIIASINGMRVRLIRLYYASGYCADETLTLEDDIYILEYPYPTTLPFFARAESVFRAAFQMSKSSH